jgi:hypothetical protein
MTVLFRCGQIILAHPCPGGLVADQSLHTGDVSIAVTQKKVAISIPGAAVKKEKMGGIKGGGTSA